MQKIGTTWSSNDWPWYATDSGNESDSGNGLASSADGPTTLDNTVIKVLFNELNITKDGHLNAKELFYFALLIGHNTGPNDWTERYNMLVDEYMITCEGMGEAAFRLFLVDWRPERPPPTLFFDASLDAYCDDDLRRFTKTLISTRKSRKTAVYEFVLSLLEAEK